MRVLLGPSGSTGDRGDTRDPRDLLLDLLYRAVRLSQRGPDGHVQEQGHAPLVELREERAPEGRAEQERENDDPKGAPEYGGANPQRTSESVKIAALERAHEPTFTPLDRLRAPQEEIAEDWRHRHRDQQGGRQAQDIGKPERPEEAPLDPHEKEERRRPE